MVYMNTKQEEIKILNFQNIVTTIYILSLILSIYITNIDKDCIVNPDKKHPNTIKLAIFNRTLVVVLTLLFLYISIQNRKIGIQKGKKTDLFNLQVMASEITLLSTVIVLYVVIKSMGENYTIISGVSNPNL